MPGGAASLKAPYLPRRAVSDLSDRCGQRVLMEIDSLTPYDRVQLLEVYARSVMLLELGRCTEWADLFLPQALVRCAGASEQAPVEFKGRDALLALGRRLMS